MAMSHKRLFSGAGEREAETQATTEGRCLLTAQVTVQLMNRSAGQSPHFMPPSVPGVLGFWESRGLPRSPGGQLDSGVWMLGP